MAPPLLIQEVAHQQGLLAGLAVVGWQRWQRAPLPLAYQLVALAFLVSWFADSFASAFGGATWVPAHTYPVLQLALVYFALMRHPRQFAVFGLLVAGLIGAALAGPYDGPEVWVQTFGSLGVVLLVHERRDLLRPVLLLYFGLGTALSLLMTANAHDYVAYMPFWYGYQAVRLLSVFIFVMAVLRYRGEAVCCGS